MSRLDIFDADYSGFPDTDDPLGYQLYHSGLSGTLSHEAGKMADLIGFRPEFDSQLDYVQDSTYHVIESNVGDDSSITTDSLLYACMSIACAQVISFIKLSMKDVGISRRVSNYAEGWLLTPLTAESSFEAVNRHNRTHGVPFTMDPVKLKLLSAVRKQSSQEMDLESKLTHLAEIASWTDPNWFTYDFHQMALMLANCVFDFTDARTFPYLFKTEGGCGGLPPYGNLFTAYSAMHYYTRGRSQKAILGVMKESVMVNNGHLAPKDTFFLRASHLANAGDKVWAHYETAYRTLLAKENLSRAEARDVLRLITQSDLPSEIVGKGYELNPDSFVVGSAISRLRQDGYLMTEVDIKLLEQRVAKEQAVFGQKPIGEILIEQEEERRVFKSHSWKVLTELYSADKDVREQVDAQIGSIPQGFESFSAVAKSYYSMRGDHHAEFSSFFYTDSIRVFKTQDVHDYFGVKENPLQEDFSRSSFIRKYKATPEENRKLNAGRAHVEGWLNSGSLKDILKQPVPIDLGTDDARILKEIVDYHPEDGIDCHVFVLLTDDQGLMRTATAMARQKPWPRTTAASVVQIRVHDYMSLCLSAVREEWEMKMEEQSFPPRRTRRVEFYNYMTQRMWLLPQRTVDSITERLPRSLHRVIRIRLLYDVSNIERQLEKTSLNKSTFTVTRWSGGCIERRTLASFPKSRSWAELPIGRISQWPDFSLVKRRVVYPREMPLGDQALVYRAEDMASAKRMVDWLNIQRQRTLSG